VEPGESAKYGVFKESDLHTSYIFFSNEILTSVFFLCTRIS